jgi:hypothetical protein
MALTGYQFIQSFFPGFQRFANLLKVFGMMLFYSSSWEEALLLGYNV